MNTVTKTGITRTPIWSAQTLTAGASNTNSSWVDLTTKLGAKINIQLTNGGTGPTLPAQVQVQTANNYNGGAPTLPINEGGALQGTTTSSDTPSFTVELSEKVAAFRLVAGSNTGQNVTVDADYGTVDSLTIT